MCDSRSIRTPHGSAGRPIIAALVLIGGLCLFAVARAHAQYDLTWNTIDGGGATFSTGGAFSLGGTIGQPDAGAPMTGGAFSLVGGFWTGAANLCTLPGDLNLDGLRDGQDVQLFVNCLITGSGSNCVCADMDGGGVSTSDVSVFVQVLLAG